MIDLIKKGILTSVGLGLMTKEKIVDYAKKAAKEAKLTEEDVRAIREEVKTKSMYSVAKKYGVARSSIKRIRDRKIWKTVE